MARYVALFGSINVGGNRLTMADLRAAFEAEGFSDVETVVASGNVLFDHDARPTRGLEEKVSIMVEDRFDMTSAALVRSRDGRRVFASGHSEFDRETLAHVYYRDRDKGLPIDLPQNYFPSNDPSRAPRMNWHAHASLLFANWLNYFVYQETPYELAKGLSPLPK